VIGIWNIDLKKTCDKGKTQRLPKTQGTSPGQKGDKAIKEAKHDANRTREDKDTMEYIPSSLA
jgi:hypothetical protein